MILLTANHSATSRSPCAVLLFGAGMVGSAISTQLQQSGSLDSTFMPLDWGPTDLFAGQLMAIEARLTEFLSEGPPASNRAGGLHFVWCAGQAGFYSTEEQVSRELNRYQDVLQTIERIVDRFPDIPAKMILISSAGGLFEGQRGVTVDSIPAPSRPYSRLKLAQEELLLGSRAFPKKEIYRLTSVYGYIRTHQRRGLIPTLVANGLCQRPCQITGYSTTIRDYVWIEDVAEYVSRTVMSGASAGQDRVEILASGKPSSILEIRQIVENTISRSLSLHYSLDAANGDAMSFDAGVLPEDWHPSELSTNVRKIAIDALHRQTLFLGL